MRCCKTINELGGARVILCTAPNGKAISDLIPGLGRNGQAIIVTGASDMMQIPPTLLLGENVLSVDLSAEILMTLSDSAFLLR